MEKEKFITSYRKFEFELGKAEKDLEAKDVISKNKWFAREIAEQLFADLKSGNFTILYQPIYEDGKITRAEALFRWKMHDTPINPHLIAHLVNYFKFDERFSLCVFNQVCKDAKKFAEINPDVRISFNLSPKSFDKVFCGSMLHLVEKNGVSPKNLAVELLESTSFRYVDEKDMKFLKEQGFEIYLDDYGTGYANFGVVANYPFDVVKLAGSLVTDIDKKLLKQSAVNAVVKGCKSRDIKIVAERIEREGEYEVVKDLGVDLMQGYYFSKPITAEEFSSKLESQNAKVDEQTI